MSFFSRSSGGGGSQPPPPPGNSGYSRLPPGAQDPYRAPPANMSRMPQPQPRYEDHEKRSYQQQPQPGYGQPAYRSGGGFAVTPSPSDQLAFSNCLIVNPGDFQSGQHVLVKQQFVLTTLHDNTGQIPPGTIGASSMQRSWIGLSTAGDSVTVEPLPYTPSYLQSIDVVVGFLRKGREIAEQFSADEMAKIFLKAYGGIVFSQGQLFTFEFHGQVLKAEVSSLSTLELADGQRGGQRGGAPSNLGVLMEKSDVNFIKAGDSAIKIKSSAKKAPPNAILAPNFKFEDMGIGGLDSEFSTIFRRAFASRVFPPGLVEKLGIQHVKGILLHGPPGTGKTLMARQIGKMLNAREPKIVNGPEVLNKYVGQSEENIRKLFADAEKEYKEKADESGLHIIIFDELDAICKQRGSTQSGTGVGDSIVNQLLSKMDGVDQLNNILIIGMTNRLDMIDEALLRPGRLEVHMEISLPDEKGRFQILNIHTAKMRTNKVMDRDVDLLELAQLTKNFSGAEIGGLVKSATSFAFSRHVKVGTLAGVGDDIENMQVNRADFMNALDEVTPAFGVAKEELEQVVQNGIIHFAPHVNEILHSGQLFVEQVRGSTRTPLVTVLLHGPPGSGKTALAATIAQASQYPFMKLLSPESMVGFSESQKVAAISKVFADSYKSPLSVIVVDSLERLLEFTAIGPRFSNPVLQTLMVLFSRRPPKGRRLLIVATTSLRPVLTDLGLSEVFDAELRIPPISTLDQLTYVLDEVQLFPSRRDRDQTLQMLEQAGFNNDETTSILNIGIKKLLTMVEMARQEPEAVGERLASSLMGLGM